MIGAMFGGWEIMLILVLEVVFWIWMLIDCIRNHG